MTFAMVVNNNKMADRQVTLSGPLCFLFGKLATLRPTLLKSIIMDFYSVESIAVAKELLYTDLKRVNCDNELPQFIRRRESPSRLTGETEDLFKFVTFADENKLSDQLPIYAVANVDDIPAARLYEGDLEPFLRKLNTTVIKVSDLGQRMAAISNQVACIQRDLRLLISPQATAGPTGATNRSAQSSSTARTTTTWTRSRPRRCSSSSRSSSSSTTCTSSIRRR